jgi:hypothetical protein
VGNTMPIQRTPNPSTGLPVDLSLTSNFNTRSRPNLHRNFGCRRICGQRDGFNSRRLMCLGVVFSKAGGQYPAIYLLRKDTYFPKGHVNLKLAM